LDCGAPVGAASWAFAAVMIQDSGGLPDRPDDLSAFAWTGVGFTTLPSLLVAVA
jgi:hypothetical protein